MAASDALVHASRQLLSNGAETTAKFEWIVVMGGFFAFLAAFGIGANDVANAFATSVGSGALTIKHAVMLAAVFEFCGALFMGGHVVKTIRKGIADQSCFTDDPGLLMYGCLCVIFSVAIWLVVASFLEMPVSTTHSCVGGMIGMTMVARGSSCVVWSAKSDTFPYIKGVAAIVVSWLLSPIVSGGFSFVFFFTSARS
jgi:sodium-dependent phosphate transporter